MHFAKPLLVTVGDDVRKYRLTSMAYSFARAAVACGLRQVA